MSARLLALALVVPLAAAQPADGFGTPDVVGTWELSGAENVPVDDVLVFARLTISGDRIAATYLFLDPDDGELSVRTEDARYVVSAGQLVLRDDGRTTVWDAARDGTMLTVQDRQTGVLLRLRAAGRSERDPELVGTWTGTRTGAPFTVWFAPDGQAHVEAGGDREDGRWRTVGPYVLLGDEPAWYSFTRDADGRRQLVVEAEGERSVLDRTD